MYTAINSILGSSVSNKLKQNEKPNALLVQMHGINLLETNIS